MPEISKMDKLLTMLESATVETDKYSTSLNEEIDIKLASVFDKVNSFINVFPRVSSSYKTEELHQLINQVNSIHLDGGYRASTYPNMQIGVASNTLNVTSLFDFVLNEIKKHSAKPSQTFNPTHINQKAIANACKQCTGKMPSELMTLPEFKYQFQLAVFGGFNKIIVIPNLNRLTNNALRVPIMIKFIDNRLIHQHISQLKKYKSDLEAEFDSLEAKDPSLTKYFNAYADAIGLAIENTLRIYKIMRNVYTQYDIEFRNVLRNIVEHNKSNNESAIETNLLETANFISSAVKPLRKISSNISEVLNESASPDTDYNISESLNNFLADFKERAFATKEDRLKIRTRYLTEMGLVTKRLNLVDAFVRNNPDIQIQTYSNINRLFDIEELEKQLSKNAQFLTDILEHCDKYSNKDIKFFIKEMIPSSLQHCIPDSEVNFIGVLLTQISQMICGDNRYIHPDIYVISQNIVSIPNYLGIIDSHINNLVSLIEHTINELVASSSSASNELKMVIDVITNAAFAYLAIILNVYKDLSIIEDSALHAVTAISEMLD